MKAIPIFNKTTSFKGIYVFFMINRLQMLYFVLIMPSFLEKPYMIWGIIGVGLLSQLNLFILSKWFASNFSGGYQDAVKLFGQPVLRFFAFIGIFVIATKLLVITLSYVAIIHLFIFPSMNDDWLVLFIFLAGFYLASQGIEKTFRFSVIAFLTTIGADLFFLPFFWTSNASLHDLFPLIPTTGHDSPWKGLLFIWSSLSCSEYLICLGPWLANVKKIIKPLSYANMASIVEYLYFFIASLLFFGSSYLKELQFPLINMLQYLLTPILERIDILFLSLHMFILVFSIAFFVLFFYGGIRMSLGKMKHPTTWRGLLFCGMLILAYFLLINESFWKQETGILLWINIQIVLGSASYFVVPIFLLIAVTIKRKRRIANAGN